MGTTKPGLVRLTQIIRSSLVDQAGETVGRVDDLIVRLGSGDHPPVTGLQARIGGRHIFVPVNQVAELGPVRTQLTGETVNLQRFERREGEVLLQGDILDRKFIHIDAGRLLRASDIALDRINGAWHVVGIDACTRNVVRRALHSRSSHPLDPARIVDWSRIEPFVGHVPTAKLHLPLHRLKQLHPAQIADLVEAASPDEGNEIITAVRGDPELEADVFEELNTEHQVEFLESRSDVEAAAVLASMAPDDAADLISDLPQARRASILGRLPSPQQAKVRSLLAYNPSTAGGLMTPDFIAVDQNSTIEQAIERVSEASITVAAVYVTDRENRMIGSLSLQNLLRADRDSTLRDAVALIPVRLRPEADVTEVAIMLADYNLVEAPVVDEDNRLVGVVAVDDVLETLIPHEWRRREEE